MKLVFLAIYLQFVLSVSFLLDTVTQSTLGGQSSLTDRHFVTVIELLSEEKQIRHQLEQSVIQLQQEIASINNRVNSKHEKNCLCNESDIIDLRKQIHELMLSNETLTENIDNLTNKNGLLATDLNFIKNETNLLKVKMSELSHLKNINQLQTVHNLEQAVQSLGSKTDLLISHESARQQDFMAILNQVDDSKNKIQDLQVLAESSRNLTFTAIEEVNKSLTSVKGDVLQYWPQLVDSSRKVALYACAGTSSGFELNSNTLKFPVITTAIGISGLSSFTSSGQFVCEYSGLYHITVVIMSNHNNQLFSIYQNHAVIATGFIPVFDSNQGWHTGISSFTTRLDKNDKISVDVARLTSNLFGQFSCINIVKVN